MRDIRWRDVREANSLGCAVAILLLVACWRDVAYVLEKPLNSQLLKFKPIQKALIATNAKILTTYLQSFSPTFPIKKALSLVYTANWASFLERPMPTSTRNPGAVYTVDPITGQVTGGEGLADTAAYPPEFATSVAP
jgi:hypothetical protein